MWIYERRRARSGQGGTIDAVRRFGHWTVSTGRISQACALLDDVWRDALFRRLPKDASAKRVLMVGLGVGSTVPIFKKRFPGCHIVAIERDPEMVRLMDALRILRPEDRPEVVLGDALEALPSVRGTFDVVCSDIFDGNGVAPAAKEAAYAQGLASKLVPYGYLVANVFEEPEALGVFSPVLAREAAWKFRTNHLGLFRPHGAGVVGDPVPDGYRRYMATRGYLEREFAGWPRFRVVHAGTATGVSQSMGLFGLDIFRGDDEPRCVSRPKGHVDLWYPTVRMDVPAGWRRFPVPGDRRMTGFAPIGPLGDRYWERWSSQAQRHRKQWERQAVLERFTPAVEEYVAAYADCGMRKSLIDAFTEALVRKSKTHAGLVRLFGAREADSKKMVAGLATLDIPESHQAMHVTSFIHPSVRSSPVGVALVDAWFADAQARGLSFLDFDGFYAPGDPVSWKGYSKFKAQFGVHFIKYPGSLVRWVPAAR